MSVEFDADRFFMVLFLHMETKKILKYTAIFEAAPEGGYVVTVPALPGCMTQGDTFEEATENIREVIELCLSVLKEDGDDIPEESEERIVATVRAPMPQ